MRSGLLYRGRRPNAMPQYDAPVLTTERLTLRVHGLADFDDSAAMWADEGVTRHIGGKPSTREESWARLLRYGGLWPLLGYGYWVVRETATGRFVGETGFANFNRDLDPPFGDVPEAGWALSPWAQGRGFASEALHAVLAWGDRHFDGGRVVCIINEANSASLRLADKLGFREYARAINKGAPTILFERLTARNGAAK